MTYHQIKAMLSEAVERRNPIPHPDEIAAQLGLDRLQTEFYRAMEQAYRDTATEAKIRAASCDLLSSEKKYYELIDEECRELGEVLFSLTKAASRPIA